MFKQEPMPPPAAMAAPPPSMGPPRPGGGIRSQATQDRHDAPDTQAVRDLSLPADSPRCADASSQAVLLL